MCHRAGTPSIACLVFDRHGLRQTFLLGRVFGFCYKSTSERHMPESTPLGPHPALSRELSRSLQPVDVDVDPRRGRAKVDPFVQSRTLHVHGTLQ
jgi:hypothetical protein